jgi:hypothetical protein
MFLGLLHEGMINKRVYELIGEPAKDLHAAIDVRRI